MRSEMKQIDIIPLHYDIGKPSKPCAISRSVW
jgi:hypothetical protein